MRQRHRLQSIHPPPPQKRPHQSRPRLLPIAFSWTADRTRDVGFGAEEVAAVEPLLATRNAAGEIEGVKYKQISAVLVNAVNEQQTEIESQRAQIEDQKAQIQEQARRLKLQQEQLEALKKLVCGQNPEAGVCREKEQE